MGRWRNMALLENAWACFVNANLSKGRFRVTAQDQRQLWRRMASGCSWPDAEVHPPRASGRNRVMQPPKLLVVKRLNC